MQKTLRILPLRLIAYSDKSSILTAFSREMGAISFVVPSGKGPAAARRRALLAPLTPLEVEATIKPGKDVHTFHDPRPLLALHCVQTDPVRVALVMFLSEVLQPILRQSDGDAQVFDFIVEAITLLNEESTATANFHLAFLIGLASVLGIAPDAGSYQPGRVFDMVDACFRQSAALHGRTLMPEESVVAERLLRMTWENMACYRFSSSQRAKALNFILEYYTLHYANLSSLKSLDVLHDLFA